MTPIARRLRREPTNAERKLWALVRAGRLGGLKFRRQHPIAGKVADLACPEARLVVELDGVVHEDEDAAARDAERTRVLEASGWRVLRVRNADVQNATEDVLTAILEAARAGLPVRRD